MRDLIFIQVKLIIVVFVSLLVVRSIIWIAILLDFPLFFVIIFLFAWTIFLSVKARFENPKPEGLLFVWDLYDTCLILGAYLVSLLYWVPRVGR